MIRETTSIILKNLRLLLRSRSSALIILFGPLFLMLLVGFAFNSVGTRDVEIGIYSERYTPLTLNYVKSIADGPFHTLKYNSQEVCVDHIKKGLVAGCVVFPAGMTPEDTKIDEIIFYVDYSRVNIVYQILERVLNEVRSTSGQISLDLTNTLLETLSSLQQDLNESQPVMGQIITLESNVSYSLGAISKDLSDLSVRFSKEEIDLKTASQSLGSAQNTVSDIYNGHTLIAKRCDDALDLGLDKALDCASTQDDEDELRSMINHSKVFAGQAQIEDSYQDIQQEFNETRRQLLLLDTRLVQLEGDLEKVARIRSDAQKDLSFADATTLQAKEKTQEIRKLLGQMYTLIDNIQLRNANAIITPVKTTIEPVVPETKNLLYLFPTLLALVLMFSSVLLASSLVMTEKKSKAYFRNFISPVGVIPSIIGTFITALFTVLLQMGVLMGIAYFYLDTQFPLAMIALLLLLIASLFILLGQIIGELFNSDDTVTLGAISLCSLFLFLSDVILPFERMPALISGIAQFNPFVLASQSLKKAMLFSESLGTLQSYLFIFCTCVLALFILLIFLGKTFRKRAINKMTNQYSIRKEKKKEGLLIKDME